MSAGSFGASAEINAAVTADVDAAVAADKGLILLGYSVKESKAIAAAAALAIVNGADVATGQKVAYVELAADTSETVWLGNTGIHCPNGLTVDHIAGEFDITLYYRVCP